MRKLFPRRPHRFFSSPSNTSTSVSSNGFTTPSTSLSSVVKSPPVSLSPGDEPVPISPGHHVTPAEIRDLNDLIRKRYALDVEICAKRDCRPRDRPLVEENMGRADAALGKILGIVQAWDKPEVWKLKADWDRLKEIRRRLEMQGGKKLWSGNPPWES